MGDGVEHGWNEESFRLRCVLATGAGLPAVPTVTAVAHRAAQREVLWGASADFHLLHASSCW